MTNACLVSFAGRMGSGKTTISSTVATALGWARVGFGDYVRAVARQRGMGDSRETLQALGESLLAEGSERFCRAVLAQADWQPGQSLIVDGIRHVQVVDALRQLAEPSQFLLVLISTDEEVRRYRLQQRDGDGQGSLHQAELHSTETQVQSFLPEIADLIVNGDRSPYKVAEEVAMWVQQQILHA